MKTEGTGTPQAVLVTGGCGYIGSHVVRQLSLAGHKTVILDDLSNGFRELHSRRRPC